MARQVLTTRARTARGRESATKLGHRRPADPLGVRPGLILALPVAAGLLFLLLPVASLALRSISGQGVGGVVDMLGNELFVDAVQRTLLLATVVTIACVAIGSAYAVAIVVAPPALSWALLAVLFSTFWISILVRTFGWVVLLQPNGALDQLLHRLGVLDRPLDVLQTTVAMYPAMVHVMLPFLILPVYASCLRLDPDLLRAAQSLGGKPLAVVRHVLVPHILPAVLAGASIVFLVSLAFYVTPLLLGGPSNLTVATLIDREFSQVFDLASAATMAIILLAVVLALYLLIDRFVRLIPAAADQA